MKTKHRWYIIAAAVLLAAAAAVGILGYFRYGSLVPGAGSGNNAGRELVLEQNYAYARRASRRGTMRPRGGCSRSLAIIRMRATLSLPAEALRRGS